jgi:hypothetical protein
LNVDLWDRLIDFPDRCGTLLERAWLWESIAEREIDFASPKHSRGVFRLELLVWAANHDDFFGPVQAISPRGVIDLMRAYDDLAKQLDDLDNDLLGMVTDHVDGSQITHYGSQIGGVISLKSR